MTDRPDDEQWRPVDPPTEGAGPYQPNPYPQGGPYGQGDPYGQGNPPTRAFDPYAGGQPYPQEPQYGGGPAYGGGQYPGGPGYPPPGAPYGYGQPAPDGPPPPGGGGGSSRTLWLIVAIVALVVVVAVVAGYFLVSRSNGDDSTAAAASTSSVPTTDDLLPTLDNPSAGADTPQTSASAAPGQVLYALSGNGQVLGVTYTVGTRLKISPTLISPPWSVAATVDSDPSLTAVVLSGSVTCTISRDGQVLTTATSSTGLLRCAAPAG
ncbi:hypothetical protein [Williamsia deligens]|uniref:MmpS family membrane protein n=1 Tax=Williamsia deligens TaxID=321325 RepID=A0ABW3G4K5_9NOCA|nr:hypothetical protein [Williamsia deligens]MCP2194055.1 hypothetical protein [Williamsia deligens]